MADTRISDLAGGAAVSGTDVFPNVQTTGVGPVKTTATQLKTFMSASPTLVTPTLGVATATSINKVAFTAPATGSTLTIADGKTLTASNTLTLTGTDSSSVAFGTGGTVLYSGEALGTPSSGTLTSCTGLPISTGISGLGTGVATALAVNAGSAGAFVRNNTAETISGALTMTSAAPQLTLGADATTLGQIKLFGSTSGDVTVKPAAAAGTATVFQLPASNGTNGYVLQTDGAGVTSWVAGTGGLAIGTTAITGGAAGRLLFEKSDNTVTESSLLSFDSANGALSVGGATVTTSNPALNLTQTWNAGAVTFTGILLNVTDTASAAASLLIDLQVGASSKFKINKSGTVIIPSGGLIQFEASSGCYLAALGGNQGLNIRNTSNANRLVLSVDTTNPGFIAHNTAIFGWSSAGGPNTAASVDTYLIRAAAAIIQIGAADAAAPVAQALRVQSVVAGTSNTAGVSWTRRGSLGTGTGGGGNIIEQTGFAGSSGTSQNTAVDRSIIVGKGKSLTDNTATSLFEVALPTLAMCGGIIEATVICTDGTDMQVVSNEVSYAAVNKGASYTTDIDVAVTSTAVSAGTLTNTWSVLTGTDKVTIQLTSDTTLTPTKFRCYYTVRNNSEQATTIV